MYKQDPLLEFEVESQFEGRPIAQLASVIIKQVSVHNISMDI